MAKADTKAALDDFIRRLHERDIAVDRHDKVPARSPKGYIVREDRLFTTTGEVFHVKIRTQGRWIPKARSQVGAAGQPLAERYEFVIGAFGQDDASLSGLNEDTVLQLLDLEEQGYRPFLVTIFPTEGEVRWLPIDELYGFVIAYGTLPQKSFQGNDEQTFVSFPTGLMHAWDGLVIGPPAVAETVR